MLKPHIFLSDRGSKVNAWCNEPGGTRQPLNQTLRSTEQSAQAV